MAVNPDPINGTIGNDNLIGTIDDDTFNSLYPLPIDGGGEDKMAGGLGNDTYYVNSLKDIVVEVKPSAADPLAAGIDTVIASISYRLTAHVERLILAGSGNLAGTGNELANEIIGNARNNILDGGKNADLLFGGTGDDVYIFDNLGDVADEKIDGVDAGGNDTIKSSVFSATFFSDASQHEFIENFTYTGKLAWTFTGDAQNNRITGGLDADTLHGMDGNDWLDGGKGADMLHGGKGDDTYVIDNKGDRIFEAIDGPDASGRDLVRSTLTIDLEAAKLNPDKTIEFKYYEGVEDVILLGKAALRATGRDDQANRLTGNDGNNILDGRGGDDALYGGLGKDTLIGGAGDDFIDGGDNIDVLVLSGSKDDYTLRLNADGSQLIRDDNPDDGNDGTDHFINIEALRFSDLKSMPIPTPLWDANGAVPNVLNEEDASQNGQSAGITAQAMFPGDLPVFYSLVNPGGIFAIDSTTGEVTVVGGELLDFETNNGVYNLIVRATAEKGPALEREFAITIINKADQPADTPTIDPTFSEDTGIPDNITEDTTPTISGTSTEIGGQVFIYDTFNGETKLIATTTVLFGGTWNVTLTKMGEGVHVLKAAVQDLFGNPSALSDPLTIEIDTITPFAPVALGVTAETDTGLSPTDGITQNTSPTITGQAPGEEGSIVHLYSLAGNVLTEIGTGTVGAGGTWTAALTTTLGAGTYDIRAIIEDGAGHVGPLSAGYRLIVDNVAPAGAPTLTLSPASNSGNAADTITNDTTPTLRGSTEPNAKVHIYDAGNVEIGSAIADSTGQWSFTIATPLSVGSHTFTAQAEDVAGNLSPVSPALALTITSDVSPAAPTLAVESNSGSPDDGVTNDSTPTILVSGAGTLHLFQNGVEVPLSGGSYTATPLADGEYFYTVTADGTADASPALIVRVDTTAPSAVALTGQRPVDENQADTTVVGTLTATDATAVTFSLGGTDAALFSLGADGRTLIYNGGAVNYEAPKTSFSLQVTATDVAGNSLVQPIVVNVRDLLEGVTASQTQFFVAENNIATQIATVAADGGATLSLVGDTASYFTLAGGNLTLNAGINFEDGFIIDADNDLSNGKQLVAFVQASNGIDSPILREVIVTIVDVQEARTVSAGDSILVGGIGSDRLTGGNNSDTLIGNGGDDLLIGVSGGDLLDGGEGKDTVSYAGSTGAVTVNLSSGEARFGDAENDGLISIENVIGSSGNDTLTGDSGDNVLEGGAGNDILNGGNHGAFGDTVSYAGAPAAVTVNLSIATAQNTIGAGNDTLSNFENIQGSAHNDTLTGNGFDNVLIGGAGADTLNGGAGSDTASYFNATAGVIANLIAGGSAGDAAGDSYNSIENLFGSIFADTLIGDGMANVIAGAGGHDTLTGGAGPDVFKYHLNPGATLSEAHSDVITDFEDGADRIDLRDLNLSQSGALEFQDLLDNGSLAIVDNQIFADLDGGGDDLVLLFTVQNAASETLTPDDFIV